MVLNMPLREGATSSESGRWIGAAKLNGSLTPTRIRSTGSRGSKMLEPNPEKDDSDVDSLRSK
jgi:hypothetical protein